MAEIKFHCIPHPDHPGWDRWESNEPGLFNDYFGLKLCRPAGENRANVRFFPERKHANLLEGIHGGALLAFIDIALFGAGTAMGLTHMAGSSTVELSTQFMTAGRYDEPLDSEVELLRETGRMYFMRGLFRQGDDMIVSFSAIVRKASRPSGPAA